MASRNTKKQKTAFTSKADTAELREYQHLASKFPPLEHEEILVLSEMFIKGRNLEVSLEEHALVDAVTGGNWDEDNLRERKDAILDAYAWKVKWLSEKIGPADILKTGLACAGYDEGSTYDFRDANLLVKTPWMKPMSLADVCQADELASKDSFDEHENLIHQRFMGEIEKLSPRAVPKDIVDRWKTRKAEMNRHFMSSTRELTSVPEKKYRNKITIQSGQDALTKIVSHNLQLAMSRVGKIMKNSQKAQAIEVSDLIGAANMGLVLGARQFDPTMGRHFSTYAAYHIDGQLYTLINTEDGKSGIKGLSVHEQKQFNTILSLKTIFRKLYDRTPTVAELQSISGISANVIRKRLQTPLLKTQSLHAPVGRGDDNRAVLLEDICESDETIESQIEQSEYLGLMDIIKHEINLLPELQRAVVMGRMGLSANERNSSPKSMPKIAAELDITTSDVAREYEKAIETLRNRMELRGWSADALPSFEKR